MNNPGSTDELSDTGSRLTPYISPTGTGISPRPSRWAIPVIALAQLMVTLDNSIVNIALPSAQADLGFSDGQRAWIVTSYALAFGSLLMLGGRLSDIIGRRRSFLIGVTGFAVASVLGGLAPNFPILVLSRALQGVFGALLAPAALSLLTVMFPSGRQRARAFGIFAAIAISGSAVGMLLGGVLTEYLNWRWCMYVNAGFAAVAFVGAFAALPSPGPVERPRLDIPGTVLVAGGSFCLVFGLSIAETSGWASGRVIAPLIAGILLLTAFFLVQRNVASPLLPLRVILDRARGGALVTAFIAVISLFSATLFLTYMLQQQYGFSPLMTGLAFLPMVLTSMAAATAVPSLLLDRLGQRTLTVNGLLIAAGALYWLSFLTEDSTYFGGILTPLLLLGIGLGTSVSTSINRATSRTLPEDAGPASAAINAVQQIGGSIGLALLASIAATVTESSGSVTDGYGAAFFTAGLIFIATAAVVAILIPGHRNLPQ
ncbi:MAG: Uncharacterized MFS-type transporter [uncultured Arthrobacter sp.]|uniref:Uncharacterized MFS-type transporter n=1 Tax=uncultured Arthrobacter sp. TaxID=114050 RepID=A0A6J4J917_9MICC|nr:MFS transporter [uncultured Arthrobacter sp.]CAA9270146.1 MAG: Uncharacterized MFS-type transporter [uncultured Arthrobacter sp.]